MSYYNITFGNALFLVGLQCGPRMIVNDIIESVFMLERMSVARSPVVETDLIF